MSLKQIVGQSEYGSIDLLSLTSLLRQALGGYWLDLASSFKGVELIFDLSELFKEVIQPLKKPGKAGSWNVLVVDRQAMKMLSQLIL